jgi:uncharacterized protein
MKPVAVAVFCKTPSPGFSKTRLSPPLRPEDCSLLSTCFISDVAVSIVEATGAGAGAPFAVYTPAGSEASLRSLLPAEFQLLLQCEGDFGTRLSQAVVALLNDGHAGVILLNSDSPTLPVEILKLAITAVRSNDAVVLGPAIDGGYTLIGLSRPHLNVFADIPWSTSAVFERTVERAAEANVPVITLPKWYDVDDAATLRLLEAELNGVPPDFAQGGLTGAAAPATREFLRQHLVAQAAS